MQEGEAPKRTVAEEILRVGLKQTSSLGNQIKESDLWGEWCHL